MQVNFKLINEPVPGQKWLYWFNQYWPLYRAWFLKEGESQRPTYRQVMRALDKHMPEITHNIEFMTELAGGGDHTARFLGQYCPPPFFAACSQAILTSGEPVLVRNYDYSPKLFDGLILNTRWNERSVIGMSDCMTGLVDGMNDSGLAISLAFGGRQEIGNGFGIGLVQRYILETCNTVEQAVSALKKIPLQISYNVAVVDQTGDFATLALTPDKRPRVTRKPVSTNHQTGKRWEKYTRMIESDGRYKLLSDLVESPDIDADKLIHSFLTAPVYRDSYDSGYGTLYTAAYFPVRKEVHYLWNGNVKVCQLNASEEWTTTIQYSTSDQDPTAIWPAVHHGSTRLPGGIVSH